MKSPVKSRKLFARATQILPGGVDSPVRAFRAVGGAPLFVSRASGATIEDVDGNRFIDYVMSPAGQTTLRSFRFLPPE